TGLRYAPGDADGLAAKMDWAFSHPDDMRTMSENARHVYDNQYTAAKNYPLLVDIYERAVATVKSRDVTGGGARGTEDVGSQRGATTRRRTRAAFAPEKRATFV
ncbi:MAG: glycosyltransferase, partial [Blastocatellia bacterium]